MRKLVERLCSPELNQTDRWITLPVAKRSLRSTKSNKLKFKIGHYYVIAATKWLKEKGYISSQKKSHRTLLVPSKKSLMLSFILSIDDKFCIKIFKEDLSDIFTHDLNISKFIVSTLLVCNEIYRKEFIKKIKNYPSVKEVLLEYIKEHITDYKATIKKHEELKSLLSDSSSS